MENATKALMIAAGILLAILIISLGIGIFNMADEATAGVNLSGQEVQAFNQQFDQYNGNGKRGTEVNALLTTVLNSNLKNTTEGNTEMLVTVNLGENEMLGTTDQAIDTTADRSRLYNILVSHDGEGGLVNTITVTEVTSGE